MSFKRVIITLIIISYTMAFDACMMKEDFHSINYPSQTQPLTRSNLSKEKPLYKAMLITEKMLPIILKGFLDRELFKDTDRFSLNVISEGGKDLIYVVNFKNGGWVLVSCVFMKESPILALSYEGRFDVEKIHSPETFFWLEATKQAIAESYDEILSTNERNENLTIPVYGEDSDSRLLGESYFWIQDPIDTTITTIPLASVAPLISTKWGQGFPWNYKCPTLNGTKCPTGCVAVAYAQELYYLHNYLGKPTKLYHQIDTSYVLMNSLFEGPYYSPQHHMSNGIISSSRWDDMPLLNPQSQTIESEYVGDLMIELGQHLNMEYHQNVSLSVTESSVFTNYDLSCFSSSFNESIAISQLNEALPIIISAWQNASTPIGHAWIIDGYTKSHTTFDVLFQWRRIPEEYMNQYLDYVRYSERDMQMFYPGAYDGQVSHDILDVYWTAFSMNWGYDGENDDLFTMWNIDYRYDPHVLYNFQIQ